MKEILGLLILLLQIVKAILDLLNRQRSGREAGDSSPCLPSLMMAPDPPNCKPSDHFTGGLPFSHWGFVSISGTLEMDIFAEASFTCRL